MTRLEKIYREKVVPVLQKEFNYSSSMQLPGIEKISLNIGLGAASQNNKLMEEAVAELTAIAGQKAVVTRAKKSIASFKLREGMPIGARVTQGHEHHHCHLGDHGQGRQVPSGPAGHAVPQVGVELCPVPLLK